MKRNLTEIELTYMAQAVPVQSWSAREPAYKFTVLCPDRRYRPKQNKKLHQ